MKYKYKKSMFFFQVALVILYAIVLLFFLYSRNNDIKWFKKMLVTITGFMTVFFSVYSGEYLNRYVEFNENYVTFNSYRIAKKVRHFNVKYEDILNLEATMIPIIGIYKVKVKAKNVPWSIPVTWCINHHNEMYAKLCKNAREGNPKVYIDDKLIDYLAKKGYYEAD